MPTADRTTVRTAVDELVNKLRTNLAANPPTAAKPFRRVEVGDCGHEEYSRPFLCLHLLKSRPIGATSDDRLLELSLATKVVTDVVTDSHGAVLDQIGAVEDYFDGLRDSGVIAGAEGLDDRAWEFEYPKGSSGARLVTAEATQTMVVKVQRTFNRVAAL